MKVKGVICPECGAFVFSRCTDDLRHCPCEFISVDGGREQLRVGHLGDVPPKIGEYEFPMTQSDLYTDWNTKTDKYGIIPADRVEEVVTELETGAAIALEPLPEDSPWPSAEEKAYWAPKGRDLALSVVAKVNASDRSKAGWQAELIEHTALSLAKMFALVARDRDMATKESFLKGIQDAAAKTNIVGPDGGGIN